MNLAKQFPSESIIPVRCKPKATKHHQRQGTSKGKRKQRSIGRYQYRLLVCKMRPPRIFGYTHLVDKNGELLKAA